MKADEVFKDMDDADYWRDLAESLRERLDDLEDKPSGTWSECYRTKEIRSDICSRCGKAAIRPISSMPYEFCPRCGARMDGEEDAAD